jgi:DNA-binding NarL/FixJ family response regulator
VQVKKKRGGGKKPAGQAAKKGKGKRSSKAQREEHTPIVEFDQAAGGYPQVEQLGSGDIGTPLGAEGPGNEMQVDVETTLQDGLDRELEVARQAASGLGATGYELVLPQETTLMAAAAAAAEALNPDKDGLPRPRPKSFLVLGPDGSIVPTSQRQLRAEAKRKGELIDGGSSGKKRRKIQPVEQEDAVGVANDNEDEVIRQLADASADAAAVDVQQNGDSAANMFLQDTEDASESIEVGDQDSAMVLAMMGDSAQMMRLMQQQAAVASSSTSSPRQLQQQQQQQQPGGMGTYGPPPGTTHGQHAQMLLQQQLRHQRGEDTPNRTADEQIMELYQVTGPDFSQAISRAGSVSTGGLRTGSASGGSPYDLERGVGTDARRQLVAALGRNGDPTSSGREEQDPQHLFNNFQMLNPYISAAQDLAYRPNSGDGQHSDGNHFDTTDDMVVTGGREHEADDAEIDVEGEMDAIGQFAQHVGGNERDDGTTGI